MFDCDEAVADMRLMVKKAIASLRMLFSNYSHLATKFRPARTLHRSILCLLRIIGADRRALLSDQYFGRCEIAHSRA